MVAGRRAWSAPWRRRGVATTSLWQKPRASSAAGSAAKAVCQGSAPWSRVRDHRIYLLSQMPNVDLFLESDLDAEAILEFGFPQVILATGATWRRTGLGRHHFQPIPGLADTTVLTPDDIMADRLPEGRVVVFDDDHNYMGGVLAEKLQSEGCQVTLVTPASVVSSWTLKTLEQARIQARLLELGVEIRCNQALSRAEKGLATLACTYTGREETREADSVLLVTARDPNDGLFQALNSDPNALEGAGIRHLRQAGDCLSPGLIAAAVYGGHLAAHELDGPDSVDLAPFKREKIVVQA